MLVIGSSSTSEAYFDAPDAPAQTSDEATDDGAPKWKGKGKVVIPEITLTGLPDDEVTVDWTKYDPPLGLQDTADAKSEIVIQIIQESIGKVKARIVEDEERQKAEAAAEKSIQEQKDRETRKKDEHAKTPEELPYENHQSQGLPSKTLTLIQTTSTDQTSSGTSEDAGGRGLVAPPARSKKPSIMNLLRRRLTGERGESSIIGAARSSFEQGAQTARRRIFFNAIRRTTSIADISIGSTNEKTVECVSCLDDFKASQMVKAPCHSYCKDCFRRLITTTCEHEQQWPPKCCLNAIPEATIILHTASDNALRELYRQRAAEWGIPISDRIYCHEPACAVWLRPDQINRARSLARCTAGHWTCTLCRGGEHEGANCPQDRELIQTNELAEAEGWKHCPGCGALVEHREACQHMTCRCGAEFCYVCGARWSPRTCVCRTEQIAVIKYEANVRRQERQDREAAEEAGLQEALRLIEEFEREQALKAELLRQERERRAEERRRRELEVRLQREGERRRAVEVKFQDLREAFVQIHYLQRTLVRRAHNREEAAMKSQDTAALEELREKHTAVREALSAAAAAKLASKESTLQRECAMREAEERRLMEEYHAELAAYWNGRPDGEAKMEAALGEFKCKMDGGFEKWKKWMRNELESARWSIKEEQGIREELMQETDRRLVESTREKQVEFSKRKVAELRWVDVVVEERERLLTDREVDEIEKEDIEAWFAEGGLDDSLPEDDLADDGSMENMELHSEYPVPGAFT
ncbi:hypothetical protein F5B20DRAFT_586270 [Whalleya microplaca]|nr:hypothetical protein F5B20DRAFT_586270 [Whalleya microplaca]